MHDVAFQLVDRAYDEAMVLLLAARDHAADCVSRARHGRGHPQSEILQLPRSFRITARLGHVVAWIMARRAVWTGEITAAEAREERYRLSRAEACLANDDESDMAPASLQRLSRQSLGLYRRIARLDSLIDQESGAVATN